MGYRNWVRLVRGYFVIIIFLGLFGFVLFERVGGESEVFGGCRFGGGGGVFYS